MIPGLVEERLVVNYESFIWLAKLGTTACYIILTIMQSLGIKRASKMLSSPCPTQPCVMFAQGSDRHSHFLHRYVQFSMHHNCFVYYSLQKIHSSDKKSPFVFFTGYYHSHVRLSDITLSFRTDLERVFLSTRLKSCY